MTIKPIHTADDHARALAEIERLWPKAKPGTRDGDALEVLACLVEAYEREHVRIPPPDPVAAIAFRMEQEGLTNNDLLPIFKTTARVSEIMNKKRRLNLAMIRDVHARLAIPVEHLVADYELARPKRASSSRRQPAPRKRAAARA